jgi:hypothetical protein
MQLSKARRYILSQLQQGLPGNLSYHGIHHTRDVVASALTIGRAEGIDTHSLRLLETAAWMHDCGFIIQYKNHEEAGCSLAKSWLPHFNYSDADIEIICGMIMATRIPQSPNNLLEQIICDADLDYLGRDDFHPIAFTLFEELKLMMPGGLNEKDWDNIQIKFLESHQYFTNFSLQNRKPRKEQHLQSVKDKY